MTTKTSPLKWVVLSGVLLLLVAGSFGLLFLAKPAAPPREAPKHYGQLPAFQLTTQDGAAFTRETLQDKVWVANFVFTRCPTICPAITKKMAEIQTLAQVEQLPLHSVSFSVDPEHDTPEVLTRFAKKYEVDTAKWTLVTGSLEPMEATIVDGFRIAMGKEENDAGVEEVNIFHGDQFVLVDQRGAIRGYYSVKDDPEGIRRLLADAQTLVSQRP